MQCLMKSVKSLFGASVIVMEGITQRRTMMTDWRMYRDRKRRFCARDHAFLRLQLNGIRKNDILPAALREVADKEIAALPLNSCATRIKNRCVLTSRARSVNVRYRMARMAWRNLADYNYLSGIQRAMW